MGFLKRYNSSRVDRYNRQKHHWPQGAITVFAIACCVYGSIRTGYAVEQFTGMNPGAELAVITILVVLFQRFSTEAQFDSKLYRTGVRISGVAVGLLLYGTPLLLLTDLAYFLLRDTVTAPHFRAWMILAADAVTLAITIIGTLNAFRPVTVHYTIDLHKAQPDTQESILPQETAAEERTYRIVQLSDLHIGAVVGETVLNNIIRRTNSLRPDMVVLTGDMFNHGYVEECRDETLIARTVSGLMAKDGIWSVLGNHDPAADDPHLQAFYRAARIRPLDNGCREFEDFTLAGRTGTVSEGADRRPLKDLLAFAPSGKPVIVLDHDPMGIPEASECGVDLVLAGHTHRGQFFPYNLFVKHSFPKGCFYGMHRTGDTVSIVSAGAGVFQVPLRVGTRSEIVCVDIDL